MAQSPLPLHKPIKYSKFILLSHSRGPQFRAKGGVLCAFLIIGAILLAIRLLFLDYFLLTVIVLICCVFLFSYMLDIHGFEINPASLEIRDYKKILWSKHGKWSDIKSFNVVYLTRERLVIHPMESSEYSPDIYHYFLVKLVDEANKKQITLAEFKEFAKAKQLSKKVAETLGIDATIFYNKTEYV